MENSSSFKIYNASAGSGKTFNLVREYLVRIFSSDSKLAFRQILALTFTNKAVGEMKERILKMLQDFSSEHILEQPTDMFLLLKQDLNLSSEELHAKSKSVLKAILHNYAAFDISTIDKFNHRLIRTFANDLKLPANFDVELDVDLILAKAVDKLIDKAGVEPEITELLIDFSLQKIDDDKSWDVSYDLNEIAKTLKNDDDKYFVEQLKDKSIKHFENLEKTIKTKILKIEAYLKTESVDLLNRFEDYGLMHGVFNRNSLPNHFIKISQLNLKNIYENQLESNLENNQNICLKNAETDKVSLVESMLPDIRRIFATLKNKVYQLYFLKNALRNVIPLSVLHEINLCLKEILDEEGLVLISDFNSIIDNEIKKQPAPYIYERLGERYKDYFIDEFQDTSVLQWNNLIPLIDNAVSQENLAGKKGSAMLVGDAKQAIYRWRGGKPEQFINLYNKISRPFSSKATITNLESNYRSKSTIVDFNNKFFKFISKTIFSQELHSKLYLDSGQTQNTNEAGYIELHFLNDDKENLDLSFAEKTLQTIKSTQEDGFKLNDICILTRTNKHGSLIANYLSENGIPIISSESLLLSSSPKVNFIISVLKSLVQPNDKETKIEILKYLYDAHDDIIDEHAFYNHYINLEHALFYDELKKLDFHFDLGATENIPMYELAEHIVRSFELNADSDAYVLFLLDEIYMFSQRANHGLRDFIIHWENKSNKLSVVSPEGINAVKIMSIHKSKGLEFPVVIFPYASQRIYDDRGSNIWFKVDPDEYSNFKYLYVNLNKDFKYFNKEAEEIYTTHRAHLELDSINLLYVTLTRPKERLYIFCENDVPKSKGESYSRFSELFVDFLKAEKLYEENKYVYSLGTPHNYNSTNFTDNSLESLNLISTPRAKIDLNIITNQGRLWDTDRKSAIEKGNLVHYILSLIEYKNDVENVFDDLNKTGELESEQTNILKDEIYSIINHEELYAYFTPDWLIINEREIISEDGELHRPDRIMVNENKEAVIIDYKSGSIDAKHNNQLFRYAMLLEAMNYKVVKKYLVYIGSTIEILEI